MTQEEKDLLLKDLCARLPYGVKCNVGEKTPYTLSRIEVDNLNGHLLNFIEMKDGLDMQVYLSEVKPYLLPLSSMTEEQRKELEEINPEFYSLLCENGERYISMNVSGFDWFNKNHFDYRGLIPMGLALDATDKNIY